MCPGDDFTTTFTVVPSTDVVVSIPDFARGPAEVDSTGFNFANGIPLTISSGSGLTSAVVTLTYNPALITLTGATTPLTGYTVSGFSASNTEAGVVAG